MIDMILELCFLFFMVVYWFSEGCTEGYTWANAKRRKSNSLIFGSVNKKGKPSGVGLLDYHGWRLGENIGMVGCILAGSTLGTIGVSFYSFALVWLGSWMIGYFVYERALNYICFDDAFKLKGDYHLMKITIPRSNKFDWAVCILGFVIFYLGV